MAETDTDRLIGAVRTAVWATKEELEARPRGGSAPDETDAALAAFGLRRT